MERELKISAFNRKKTILTLVIHLIVFIATAVNAVHGIIYGAGGGQLGDKMIGWGYFKAFTMDSNILAGIAALFVACCMIRNLLRNEDTMPRWVAVFWFMGATGLFLTIVTVAFFLAPMDVMDGISYFVMFSGDMFIFHLTNPLLMILSFAFLQWKFRFRRSDCIWGVLPMMVYSVVYFLMVVVYRQWSDFYGFTFGGQNYLIPVVVIVIFSLTYLMAWVLVWMNNRLAKHTV